MTGIVVNVLGVQLAWFACAYGAIIGVPTVGVIACLLVMGVNFALTREHRTFLCLSILLGFYGFLLSCVFPMKMHTTEMMFY